jgi:membrane protein YqaA with SNARE-associated domain
MLRKTYDWVMSLASARHAPLALGVARLLRGHLLPDPARRAPDARWCWATAAAPCATRRSARSASILGGCVGYSIGFFLQPVGMWLLTITGGSFEAFEDWYGKVGRAADRGADPLQDHRHRLGPGEAGLRRVHRRVDPGARPAVHGGGAAA